MKNKFRSLPVKITAFIMCIISAAAAVGCILGAVYFALEEYYTNPLEFILNDNTVSFIRQDSYDIVYDEVLGQRDSYYSRSYEWSNLRYSLLSPEGEVISTNIEEPNPKFTYQYCYTVDKSNRYVIYAGGIQEPLDGDVYTVNTYLQSDLPVNDKYSFIHDLTVLTYGIRYWVYPVGIICIILSIALFVLLMCVSARRSDSDELTPGLFNRIPFDILLSASAAFIIVFMLIISDTVHLSDEFTVALCVVWAFLTAAILLGLSMSFAARLKQHSLLKNTAIWICCKFAWKTLKRIGGKLKSVTKIAKELLRSLPMIWRTVLIVVGVALFEFILLIVALEGEAFGVFLWICKIVVFAFVALYASVFMRKLQKGGEALAHGDLNYKTDTNKMFWDFKRHGENLNSIAEGMARAVDERLISERTKAELITNVSHDIKTPLTSIINYAGLIAEENCENKKHKEYSMVLIRKSEHLKRLLEDIVEISKASSGNLDVDLRRCEANILLTQAAGEFEQRCSEAGLELITCKPDERIEIMADSRRIWRVFENLMSNICKYSLGGSRVYLSLEKENGEALFIFRNTSKNALNISPEELMERFVRGDTSRTTEGNGLGLSIARSLTELQNGKMDILIDGDLFKVTLRFPII